MFSGAYNLLRSQEDCEQNFKAQPSPGEHLHDHESLDMVPSGDVLISRDNIDVDRDATNLVSSIIYHFWTHQGRVDIINGGRALSTINKTNG